jgi:hypothetical protein
MNCKFLKPTLKTMIFHVVFKVSFKNYIKYLKLLIQGFYNSPKRRENERCIKIQS